MKRREKRLPLPSAARLSAGRELSGNREREVQRIGGVLLKEAVSRAVLASNRLSFQIDEKGRLENQRVVHLSPGG
jgi:hypothetical protein